jgi:Family of unknown function (DUF6307)
MARSSDGSRRRVRALRMNDLPGTRATAIDVATRQRLTVRKGPIMADDNRTYITLHDQRVRLVADALKRNSKLGESEAMQLAVHVLSAIDHIPEKVR